MNFKNFNDMHTHITKTYQLRAVRMAIRKNAAKNKWWRECGEMRTLGCKGGACKEPLMKTKYRCFEKGNLELPFNQSQPLLGLSPEKMRIKKSQAGKPVRQQDLP